MPEIWKNCAGYPKYEVSNLGNVRSLDMFKNDGPVGINFRKGRKLKIAIGSHGYPYVQVGRGNVRTVHSLVLEAFIGPRPAGKESCHRDGNKLNANLSNLRWDTPKGNSEDKRRHGTNILSGQKAAATRERMISMAGFHSMEEMTRAGCTSRRGIRHWEDIGLLGEVERSDGGTRRYTAAQLDGARIIAAAQFGGWNLEEIKQMLIEWGPEAYEAIMTRLADQARACVRLGEQLPAPTGASKEYDL